MKIICYNPFYYLVGYNTHRAHGRKHSKTLRNNYSSDINLENDSDRVIYLAPLYILCTRKLLKGRQDGYFRQTTVLETEGTCRVQT